MTTMALSDNRLFPLYNVLLEEYGPQFWWPGDTDFEIMVGAILAQNTNWRNVVHALDNIKQAGLMNPDLLYAHRGRIARFIKPSGFYRLKSKRLIAFLDYFLHQYNGQTNTMKKKKTRTLRKELTAVHGIGFETADSILLYALRRPIFVVDTYTRRIGSRHSLYEYNVPYETIRNLFEKSLPRRTKVYNEYHALLVKVGKENCRKHDPQCSSCPVQHILSS